MRSFILLCSVASLLFSSTARAFAPAAKRAVSASSELHADPVSRRDLINGIISTAGVATATILSQPAYADVTNKIASQASLRYIKRSVREFDKLELYASMDQYSEMKEAIRAPALSEIRKNAFVLIRGAEGGPESAKLEAAYKAFISSLEKLDSEANLALR